MLAVITVGSVNKMEQRLVNIRESGKISWETHLQLHCIASFDVQAMYRRLQYNVRQSLDTGVSPVHKQAWLNYLLVQTYFRVQTARQSRQ